MKLPAIQAVRGTPVVRIAGWDTMLFARPARRWHHLSTGCDLDGLRSAHSSRACIYGDEVGIKLPFKRVEQVLVQADIEPLRSCGKAKLREWFALPDRNEARNAFAGPLHEAVAFARSQAK